MTYTEYSKYCLHKFIKFRSLTQLTCFKPDGIGNAKKLKFEGDWTELRLKLCFPIQSRTKYVEQNIETH